MLHTFRLLLPHVCAYNVYCTFVDAGNIAVRLVGGSTPYEGRVEVYYSRQWYSVCTSSTSGRSEEAAAVCRHIGLNYLRRSRTPLGSSSGSTNVHVLCFGSANSLNRCYIRTEMCYSGLYVHCSNSSKCNMS